MIWPAAARGLLKAGLLDLFLRSVRWTVLLRTNPGRTVWKAPSVQFTQKENCSLRLPRQNAPKVRSLVLLRPSRRISPILALAPREIRFTVYVQVPTL